MHGPAEQEKGLVSSLVNLRHVYGTADQTGKLVVAERRIAEIEVCAVQHIVIHVTILTLEVKPVRARLVGRTEHAAGGMSELGGKHGGSEFHLLDRIGRGGYNPVGGHTTDDRLRSGNPVQAISKAAIALSVDVESV